MTSSASARVGSIYSGVSRASVANLVVQSPRVDAAANNTGAAETFSRPDRVFVRTRSLSAAGIQRKIGVVRVPVYERTKKQALSVAAKAVSEPPSSDQAEQDMLPSHIW